MTCPLNKSNLRVETCPNTNNEPQVSIYFPNSVLLYKKAKLVTAFLFGQSS